MPPTADAAKRFNEKLRETLAAMMLTRGAYDRQAVLGWMDTSRPLLPLKRRNLNAGGPCGWSPSRGPPRPGSLPWNVSSTPGTARFWQRPYRARGGLEPSCALRALSRHSWPSWYVRLAPQGQVTYWPTTLLLIHEG